MILVTSDIYEQLHLSTRSERLASRYMDTIGNIYIERSIGRGVYTITSDTRNSFYENEMEMTISFDGKVLDTYCDCPWHTRHSVCAHIGALARILLNKDIPTFPYTIRRQTSYEEYMERLRQEAKERMIRERLEETSSFLQNCQSAYQHQIQEELQDTLYSIYMQFDAKDPKNILVSFKVGSDQKQYIIKNISLFLDDIDHHRYHEYGKFLKFTHSDDVFDESAKKVLHFMRTAHRPDTYEYANYNTSRFIHLDPYNMELLYTTFEQEDLSLRFQQTARTDLIVHISKEDTYYIASLEMETASYLSNNYIFEYLKGTINVTDITSHPNAGEILHQLSEQDLYVPAEQYSLFSKYVLKELEPFCRIQKDYTEIVPSTIHVDSIRIYGDITSENLVSFEVYGYDEQKESYPLLETDFIEETYAVDLVRAFFQTKADQIQNHVAYFDLNKDSIIGVLNDNMETLVKYCDIYLSENLKKLNQKTKYSIQVGVRINHNLLQVSLSSEDFDMKELGNILNAYHRKKKFYRCKDGKILHLQSDSLEELDTWMEEYGIRPSSVKNGKFELDGYRSLALDQKLEQSQSLVYNRSQSMKKYIDGYNQRKGTIQIDEQYDHILREYQKSGVYWLLTLYRYGLNGILADEMGLGKTIQVLALLDSIRDKAYHSLVICPASLIYNWKDEAQRFSSTLHCQCIVGNKEQRALRIQQIDDYDVSITSYDYMRRDIDLYEGRPFEYVILDEAQNIKNQKTQNAESVKRLHAGHRLALSGTPIENALSELWSIFDFLMPNYLFNYHYFRSHFETPITANHDERVGRELRTMISPFILRRTKKEVLTELPDKVDHKYLLDFNDEEQKLYMANLASVNKELRAQMKQPEVNKIAVLAMLTRLRQLCCDRRMVYDNITKPSTKILATVDLIKLMVEHKKKTLVFSSFTTLIDLLKSELDKEDITYYVLTGQTNKEQRREMVADFQTDDTSVFLISLKAGGTGLNLTAAETVIHIDPWWNVSAQNQATDRAHRIGQNANVQVYRMIMKDSIEEKILKMQEAKQDLAEGFIDGNDGSLSRMSKDDIMNLFST